MSHPEYAHHGDPVTNVIEEMAELTKALCKARRFGWGSVNPLLPPEQQVTNFDKVLAEMQDVRATLSALDEHLMRMFANGAKTD